MNEAATPQLQEETLGSVEDVRYRTVPMLTEGRPETLAVDLSGERMPEQKTANLVPPPGFKFNPQILEDYDEQVAIAIADAAYQAKPAPSFEGIPKVEVAPRFNPTSAPAAEIYAHNRVPRTLRSLNMVPRSERADADSPVEMWRIVERSKLEDGTGIVSSRIIQNGSLGDVEGFDPTKHLASSHDRRLSDREDRSTPFVSFSTDPENLAKDVILKYGFGVKGGRESVVIRVQVDPGRVITGPASKNPEVLLIGGVAPDEYLGAYEVSDFISQLVPQGEVTTVTGDKIPRDQALGYWALR